MACEFNLNNAQASLLSAALNVFANQELFLGSLAVSVHHLHY